MSDNNTNEAFWRVQYRLLLTALYQESNRFWTRFQVGLAVNGGLLAFFYALLHFGQCCEVELKYSLDMWILIIISGLGIFLSGIWYELTRNGFDWQGYWINKGKKLEAAHKEDLGVEIFRGLYVLLPAHHRSVFAFEPQSLLGKYLCLFFHENGRFHRISAPCLACSENRHNRHTGRFTYLFGLAFLEKIPPEFLRIC